MNKSHLILLISILFCVTSCKTTKYEVDLTEYETLDTLTVIANPIEKQKSGSLPLYNPSAERKHDLIHTKLELSFDWSKKHVFGIADLELKPLFYETNKLALDAKDMDFHKVTDGEGNELNYDYYDNELIVIQLDKTYSREESYQVKIEYTAHPSDMSKPSIFGGDQGLYFVNHTFNNPKKPSQIWTQGETENNSRWFPTIDKPNERCTQEIYITVDDQFTTLSNGLLISSKKNSDGTRTDYWKQSLPHAPYLFMLAIGEYAKVEDAWKDTPVDYYVEPAYEDAAQGIYTNTVEMMEFFSTILKYPYPWEKYSQITARNFVAGAMENTSATIFGEFVQRTNAELVDNGNDNIVAHELFHHWFGDLVTCESWANLTLNEGFANYSEYLWQEHKYGNFAAEHHRRNEKDGYITSSMVGGTHPLIHYGYHHQEEMFDAHSYNKGGLVLHMLRDLVGEDAFFTSLNKYLTDNAFTAVEVDELRMAFEDTTGLDLQWFFNQWYLDKGHPELTFEYQFDNTNNQLNIEVAQIQNIKEHLEIFQLPTTLAIYYDDGSMEIKPIEINQRNQNFSFTLEKEPALVVLDGEHNLLAQIEYDYSISEWELLFNISQEYTDQHNALEELKATPDAEATFRKALKSDYYYFRIMALTYLKAKLHLEELVDIALNDKHAQVRSSAYSRLSKIKPAKAYEIASKILDQEVSSSVLSMAIQNIYDNDPVMGLEIAEDYQKKDPISLKMSLLKIFAQSENPKYLNYVNDAILDANQYQFLNLVIYQAELVKKASPIAILEACKTLEYLSTNPLEPVNVKYTATNRIYKYMINLSDENFDQDNPEITQDGLTAEIQKILNNILENETDNSLRDKYLDLFETP